MNKKIYSFLIILFSYLLISSLPWNLFIHQDDLILFLQIIFQILYTIVIIIIIFKKNLFFEKKTSKSHLIFWFLPFFLVCFSNFLYPLFDHESYQNTVSLNLLLSIVLALSVVINEEIIFRYFLFELLDKLKPLMRIFLSSLIFGLCHISAFLSSFNPVDLIVILYTFGLGMLLGLMYEYEGHIAFPILLHFLFNLVNDCLFASLFTVNNYLLLILISGTVALLFASYVSLLYFLKLRKM